MRRSPVRVRPQAPQKPRLSVRKDGVFVVLVQISRYLLLPCCGFHGVWPGSRSFFLLCREYRGLVGYNKCNPNGRRRPNEPETDHERPDRRLCGHAACGRAQPRHDREYTRDIRAFAAWLGKRPVDKQAAAAWKQALQERDYAPAQSTPC